MLQGIRRHSSLVTMFIIRLRYIATLLAAVWSSVLAYDAPIAQLDYGTFQGAYNSAYNISYFQKIPFAAPATGENRFRAPQPPVPITNGTYDSTQEFDMCPQRTVNGSEDCLYLGLYSRPWTDLNTKRPVVVFFFGGAYIEGDAAFGIPPSGYTTLNVSDENDFIWVSPNYRVNAFGFLPGKEIAESPTSDLNPGLLDQQAALQWVNKHISHFGGDPNNVTIWGQSAGAGSVVAQVIANGGDTRPKLFTKAIASSPFWVKTYRYDAPPAQAIYDQLVNLTGCAGQKDTLGCLKTVDVQAIRNASLIIDNDHTYNTSPYTWAPVIDGTFLQEDLTVQAAQGRINPDLVWGMYNSHEGTNFIPPGFQNDTTVGGYNDTEASFEGWLAGYLPTFSTEQLERVKELYPPVGQTETFTYNSTYQRAGLVFRDSVLACPSFWIARAARDGGFLGDYTIPPATHGADTEWWDTLSSVQVTDPFVYQGFTGAFASFIQTGDPNAHKLTNSSVPGVPSLRSNEEFVIGNDVFSDVQLTYFLERCAFWLENGRSVPE